MSLASNIVNDEAVLKSLKQLMWKAGDAILDVYQSDDFNTEVKGDDSPLTKADLAAHNVLVEGLLSMTPDIPVVSEEDADSLQIPRTHSVYWLIDPLDGTKEFIKRNSEFTCNLALIENNKATLGFVGVPVQESLYVGGLSIASTRENKTGQALTIHWKQSSSGIIRVVASKSHLNEETQQFIANLAGEIELVQAGSSLKFLKIAEGQADIYPRLAPTCEWDTAAAQAVLEGAGGSVKQASGEPMLYGKDNILNPHFIAKGHE